MACCGGKSSGLKIIKAYWNSIVGRNKALSMTRMKICNGCELLKEGWCQACGCYMPAKSTLTDKDIKCEHPDGAKW